VGAVKSSESRGGHIEQAQVSGKKIREAQQTSTICGRELPQQQGEATQQNTLKAFQNL
jgi:hypothetical protein